MRTTFVARSEPMLVCRKAGAEQVGHHAYVAVARMIQARQPQPALDGFEQGEVRVEVIARYTVAPVVRVYDQEHLIHRRRNAVVVFVPEDHDGILPLFPNRGSLDRRDDSPHGHIAKLHKSWIQTSLGSVIVRIEVAE